MVNRIVKSNVIFLSVAFCVLCCTEEIITSKKTIEPPKSQKKALLDPYSPWVDSVYAQLSWNEKLAQLIWIQPNWDIMDSLPKAFFQFGGYVVPNDSLLLKKYTTLISNSLYPHQLLDQMLKGAPGDHFLWHHYNMHPLMNGLNASDDTTFLHQFFLKTIEAYQREKYDFIVQNNDTNPIWNLSIQKQKKWKQALEEKGLFYLSAQQQIQNKQLHLHGLLDSDSVVVESDTVFAFYFSTDWIEFQESIKSKKTAIYWSPKNSTMDSLTSLLNTISSSIKETPEITLKIRKVLALKEFTLRNNDFNDPSITQHQHRAVIKTNFIGLEYQTHYCGNSILSSDDVLPIVNIPQNKWQYISVSNQSMTEFTKGLNHYAEISEVRKSTLAFDLVPYKNQAPLIIVLNEIKYTEPELIAFIKKVREFSKINKVVVAGINLPFGEELLAELPNYIHCPVATNQSQYMLAQSIMGGNSIKGIHPLDTSKKTVHTPKIRLSYTLPEEVGISVDSIKKIDKIALEAINSKATPGCQVFVAKEGKVIFNKGFGYHAYDYKTAVHTNDVYDIASVTKVAATTLCAMHLYDKGKYKLTDSLKSFLPDSLSKFLKHPSRLNNITFQELLTHKSGLPSGLPIHKFIAYVNKLIGRFDRYYCDVSDHFFCVEVAKDFYLDSAYLDSLWVDMNRIWPGEKTFKYSDANMNTLYQVFRKMIKGKKSYDRYLDSLFYKPLNLKTTGFLPLKYLDTLKHRIAPTEYDTYWRYQVIKGHVHDPNAALYGGVAGNAGLFSNAHDLGVLFQLLLNRGSYGGKKIIEPQTVDLFTAHFPGTQRGLGFDKPYSTSGNIVAKDAPYTSYGHSGFTGICAWADTENELIFVFTSNRVHPNPNNKKLIEHGIRGRMQQVIYKQLIYNGSYKNEKTNHVPYSKIVLDSTLLVTTP